MGILNNDTVIVDAILTKLGRNKLRQGEPLGITQYAFGDTGVDYNLYNPKNKVAQNVVNLPALYDIKTEKDLSEVTEDENLELPDLSNNLDNRPVIENGQYISF